MNCPNCNTAIIDSDAAFCSNCGSPLQQAPQPETEIPPAAPSQQPPDQADLNQAAYQQFNQVPYQPASQAPQQPFDQTAYQQQYYQNAYQQPPYQQQPMYGQPANMAVPPSDKSKIAAGLLAIFLGALGIHKFYLGYKKAGLIMLLVTLLTFGVGAIVMDVIGIVEGILYLSKNDWDFYNTYVVGEKDWF